MDKALNEIGKLRNEMKLGFIELENQMRSNTEILVGTIDKMASNVEKGFVAVEEALDQDIHSLNKEISEIKRRLDAADL